MTNPLLDQWETPFGTPPFDLIEVSHFRPAINAAIDEASAEIEKIAGNKLKPTFRNTIEALEKCCEKTGRIAAVLFNLNNAETNRGIQAAAQEISPVLTRFSNSVTLNEKLFSRIKTIYESRNDLNLTIEQKMVLEKKYHGFRLGGAALEQEAQNRFRSVTEELSLITLKFEENVLEETNNFLLHIKNKADLKGLPENIAEAASLEAGKRGLKGWAFTLNAPSYIPFMKYSERRELREKMLKAYSSRAFHADERDNRSLLTRIVNLRLEIARMLGYANYAEMVLGDRMAENQQNVEHFLDDLFSYSHKAALRDYNNLKQYAEDTGFKGVIERWDWPFYSEILRKARHNFDDESLRPYFRLENVEKAILDLSSQLYGIKFRESNVIPVYHPEVKTLEVTGPLNRVIAVLYLDYFPREGKNGGAWMTSFRDQRKMNGKNIIPLISVVTNFTRPTGSKPSLLTFNELTTFLHEFGHALHAMLSRCKYESISGTNVARDFVELPSQLMQNWAFEEEWLKKWAVHFETGESMPSGLIKKIKEASTFNEGYACDRQLNFGFLDMAWHTITEPMGSDVKAFERNATTRTELFPEIPSSCLSCSFTHIFGGEYAAGYYGYKWAEVLEADAFSLFREKGIFSRETANSFRKNILEKGGSDKPLDLYIRFRGKKPDNKAFLERSGLT
jgi:peptidyl-dipeptidase Dcp